MPLSCFDSLSRAAIALALAALLSCSHNARAEAVKPKQKPPTAKTNAASKTGRVIPRRPVYKGSDVVATVEGQPITRRELTYFWLQSNDSDPIKPLGTLLADRIKANKGASPVYSVNETDLYARIYAETIPSIADTLSVMVLMRLTAIEAERKGIIVTRTETQARAHGMFEEFRRQRGVRESDTAIMKMLHLPVEIFQEDLAYQIRIEKLIAVDIAIRNGHPIGPQDWVTLRQLSAQVLATDDKEERERRFAEARHSIEEWVKEIQHGASMESVARDHNNDSTQQDGGLRGPALRGTGTKALEDAIFALKPGQMSAPLRGPYGWYVFKVEQVGDQIPQPERDTAWKQLVAERKNKYLAELRQKSRVTSTISLPNLAPDSLGAAQPDNNQLPPPPPARNLN